MITISEAAKAEWARLPFVQLVEGEVEGELVPNFWVPNTSGDYEADCARGRDYAAAMVDYLRRTGDAAILPRVVAGMPRTALCGTEIGFLTVLGSAAANPLGA